MSFGDLLRRRLYSWRQSDVPERTSEPSLSSYLGYANNLIALPAPGASGPLPARGNIRDAEIVSFEATPEARETIPARPTFSSEQEPALAPRETFPLPQTSVAEAPVPIDALKERIRQAFTQINGTAGPRAAARRCP
jgi:hypothetical protein